MRITTSSRPPVVGMVATRSSMRCCATNCGEVDLAVLRLALLADVEVAHDLDARDHRVAVARGQLEVGAHQPVLRKRMRIFSRPGALSTWMSEAPSLCASTIMVLISRTSELSLCSICASSSARPLCVVALQRPAACRCR